MFGRHSYVLTAEGSFAMISDHNAPIADHEILNYRLRMETYGCACMTEHDSAKGLTKRCSQPLAGRDDERTTRLRSAPALRQTAPGSSGPCIALLRLLADDTAETSTRLASFGKR